MIEHGTVIGNIARTHSPCGGCGRLVELAEGCKHLRRSARAERREQQQVQAQVQTREQRRQTTMIARSELLGSLGYPRT
jgi:hypothetical protein